MDWAFTCTSGFVVLVVFTVMASDVGLSNIFTWHPVLLSLAFLMCMNEGLLVYFKGKLDGEAREVSRYWHGRYMLMAALLSFGGYLAIYISHVKQNHSQFAVGHPLINQVHVILGYFILVLVLLQSCVGAAKYFGSLKAKWHGKLGLYIYGAGVLNICIAAVFWNSESWRGIVRILVIFLSIFLAVVTIALKRYGNTLNMTNDFGKNRANAYETVALTESHA